MGISEDIKELKDLIKEKEENKPKKLRLPFRAKAGKRKQKRNYVGILKINENGVITPTKQQIIEQTVMVDGIPRLATTDFVLRWNVFRPFSLQKQFPLMLLPSWSVKPLKPSDLEDGKPFNPEEHYKESMEDGSNIKGYKLLMNRMKTETVEAKKGLGGGWLKWVIGFLVLAVIGYAVLTGGFS
jgi:hypothetical protein